MSEYRSYPACNSGEADMSMLEAAPAGNAIEGCTFTQLTYTAEQVKPLVEALRKIVDLQGKIAGHPHLSQNEALDWSLANYLAREALKQFGEG